MERGSKGRRQTCNSTNKLLQTGNVVILVSIFVKNKTEPFKGKYKARELRLHSGSGPGFLLSQGQSTRQQVKKNGGNNKKKQQKNWMGKLKYINQTYRGRGGGKCRLADGRTES